MPFVDDGRKLIAHAFAHRYTLPAFNVCSLEMVRACLEAAQLEDAPIILQTYPTDLEQAPPAVMVAMVRSLCEECRVPVMLHLDHGRGFAMAVRCLRAGYSSVMYDGAGRSIDEVVAATRTIAETAHAAGAAVEVAAESFNDEEAGATDPAQALRLVEEGGADMVACSVGSVHGLRSRLDLARLEAIASALRSPLVLHGGSGIPPADLAAAGRLGVVKVNIGTALYRALRAVWREEPGLGSHREGYQRAREALRAVAVDKIRAAGAAGMAARWP